MSHRAAGARTVDAVLRASRVLVGVAAGSLADVEERVSLAQYRTLVVLASQGPVNLAALADRLGVHPSTATRSTDRLVAARLVRRTESRSDRRNVVLQVTAAGRSVVDDVTARRRATLGRVLGRLSRAEQQALVVAMDAFADAAGEADVRQDPALDLAPQRRARPTG